MTAYAVKLTMGCPRSSLAVTAYLEAKIPDFKLLFIGWSGRCLAANREQFETFHFTPKRINKIRRKLLNIEPKKNKSRIEDYNFMVKELVAQPCG